VRREGAAVHEARALLAEQVGKFTLEQVKEGGKISFRAPTRSKRNRLAISHVSRYYLEMLRFDWDERKNKSNRIKHGIWFEEAQSVFSDPHGRLFYDPEHSEHEDRFILLGVSSAARTLIVVHCYKENDSVVRIISARKTTRKEVRFYEEGI
jgi:uncharacterized DUF497 family protein